MNKIILHIPHSSERLPRGFLEHTLIDREAVLEFRDAIADKNTSELFGDNKYRRVEFKWSRIFCDVEKFIDPSKEIMSQFGMGVVYTKTNKGETFFQPTEKYIGEVIKKHYLPHHRRLDRLVKKSLKRGKVILVDCHSFCRDIIMFDDKKRDLPDICVGYNESTPTKVAELVIDFFKSLGYSTKANYPYSGSMLPDALIDAPNAYFFSVMIEINKDLYLNNPDKFNTLKRQINQLLLKLETVELG